MGHGIPGQSSGPDTTPLGHHSDIMSTPQVSVVRGIQMKEWSFMALLFELRRICDLKFTNLHASSGHFHLSNGERENYASFKGEEKQLKKTE